MRQDFIDYHLLLPDLFFFFLKLYFKLPETLYWRDCLQIAFSVASKNAKQLVSDYKTNAVRI